MTHYHVEKLATWEMLRKSVEKGCVQFVVFSRMKLLQNHFFCRNLGSFVWRKIEAKTVSVEKKRQISGMMCWDIN